MGRRIDLASLATDDIPTPITHTKKTASSGGVTQLPTAELCPNPLNRRTAADEDEDELTRMADTIGQHGVLQPLVVASTPVFLKHFPDQRHALDGARWVVLIGNRRFIAAQRVGSEYVPAVVNNDRVASMYEVMLVENSHRRDLAPLREAEAMSQVLEHEGLSQRDLAKRIGRTHTYVQQRLALLGLIPELQDALDDGRLTVERARQLGGLDETEQRAIAKAGPPYRANRGGNGVATTRRFAIPQGDPEAAARSIRSAYSGEQLTELIRLLTTDEETPARS